MSTSSTIVLSVDPGASSGLALFKDGKLRYADNIKSDYPTEIGPKVSAMRRALGFIDVSTLPGTTMTFVSETQFLKGKGGARFQSVAQIIRNAACWETVARFQGWKVATSLWPATWQKHWRLKGKTEDRKRLSMSAVNMMYPRPRPIVGRLTDNVSDAILIGLYYMSTTVDPPQRVIDLSATYGVKC